MVPQITQLDKASSLAVPKRLAPLLWRPIPLLLMVILFTGVSALLQWSAGCYRTELSGYPDEPAHLVTGLMLRDYVYSGMSTPPTQFAENYYLHYPKVGFGIWPPLFHFVEGAWFIAVPPSKISAFTLQAALTGTLAATMAMVAMSCFGWLVGIATGLAYVCLPVVQTFTGMIMADTLMALLAFWAMLSLAAYARHYRWPQAILLGVLLGLALATKSNAIALAAMPVFTLLLMRNYRGLFAWPFWAAGAIALAIGLPIEYMVMKVWTGTVDPQPYSVANALTSIWNHLAMYVLRPGLILTCLAIVGAYVKLVRPYLHRSLEPLWASAAALIASMFLFSLAPLAPEPRYHLASMAAILLFAAAGAAYLIKILPLGRLSQPSRAAVVLGAAALLYAVSVFSIPGRLTYGYPEVTRALLSDPSLRDSAILVSSENMGEGMLIAEFVLNEPRPSHYVLRATKVLSRSRWNLDNYELLFKTPESLLAYMKSIPVRAIVLDENPGLGALPHHALLKKTLSQFPEDYKLTGTYPTSSADRNSRGQIEVFKLIGDAKPPSGISVDMRYTLRKNLQ
jgi:hypothetical protein